MSKLIKLCTLNVHSVLYISYTSIQMLRDRGQAARLGVKVGKRGNMEQGPESIYTQAFSPSRSRNHEPMDRTSKFPSSSGLCVSERFQGNPVYLLCLEFQPPLQRRKQNLDPLLDGWDRGGGREGVFPAAIVNSWLKPAWDPETDVKSKSGFQDCVEGFEAGSGRREGEGEAGLRGVGH